MLAVTQLAAQLRVSLPPRFEVPTDCVEEPSLVLGRFVESRPAEETGPQLRVPADVVPLAHLILEKPRHQEALCACHFHHQAVVQQRSVRDKMVEDDAEIRGSRPFGIGLSGYLGIMRQHAGVIEQLSTIDSGFGNVAKAHQEELEYVPMVGREQFHHWIHDASRECLGNEGATPRTMKETYLAKLRQIEYDKEASLVVDIAAASRSIAAKLAIVRNKLLGIGARIAPRVATLTEAAACKAVIDANVAEALGELSNYDVYRDSSGESDAEGEDPVESVPDRPRPS